MRKYNCLVSCIVTQLQAPSQHSLSWLVRSSEDTQVGGVGGRDGIQSFQFWNILKIPEYFLSSLHTHSTGLYIILYVLIYIMGETGHNLVI